MDEAQFRHLFGERLKRLRKRRGLTQEDLAAAVDMSVQGLSKVERGLSSPQLDTLCRIARALDMPLPELVRLDETDSHLTVTADALVALLKDQPQKVRDLAIEAVRLLIKACEK